jgi:hypothetical protein
MSPPPPLPLGQGAVAEVWSTLPLRTVLERGAEGAGSLYVFESKLEERLPGLTDECAAPPCRRLRPRS